MNYKMIKHTLGWLLVFEAGFFMFPAITGLVFREWSGALSFVYSALCAGGIGALCLLRKPQNTTLYSKDGYVLVALSWIVISLFGSLPFIFSGTISSFADALFETVSGFTTTGASVIKDVEAIPKCMILWRSFTHWVGGMGVLVFIMAFLPLSGGHNMHIMRAESPGPEVSKLVPRVKTTAIILYGIYFAMTLTQLIVLLIANMPFFDAINTAFSTAGTGGFSFKNDGFASATPAQQIIVTVFMLLFSINFNSYYLVIKAKIRDAFNSEVKTFILIVASAICVITASIYISLREIYPTVGEALRHSAFTVASLISTTGFTSTNFNLWPELARTVLIIIMFIGACAGSTGGGIKVSRFIILFKGMAREVGTLIHPKQVKKITIDKRPIGGEVVRSVNAYIVCFFLIFVTSLLAISFEDRDLITNFTAVTATINNIGPGLEGAYANYADFSIFSKLVLTADMLIGRLELFPMLLLFSPSTYRK